MLRIAFTLPPDAAEEAIDRLVPLLPRGVHQREAGDGAIELSFYERAADLPPREQLRAAAGVAEWSEQEVPDDPRERRRLHGRAWEIAGRLRVRSPDAPPGEGSLPDRRPGGERPDPQGPPHDRDRVAAPGLAQPTPDTSWLEARPVIGLAGGGGRTTTDR